jgi:hypothetical protein
LNFGIGELSLNAEQGTLTGLRRNGGALPRAVLRNKNMKFPKIPFAPLLVGPTISQLVGAGLNQLVMGLNGAMMPVLYPDGWTPRVDGVHRIMTSATHLRFLGDWMNFHSMIASPGDLLIFLSDTTMVPALIAWVSLVIYKNSLEK